MFLLNQSKISVLYIASFISKRQIKVKKSDMFCLVCVLVVTLCRLDQALHTWCRNFTKEAFIKLLACMMGCTSLSTYVDVKLDLFWDQEMSWLQGYAGVAGWGRDVRSGRQMIMSDGFLLLSVGKRMQM